MCLLKPTYLPFVKVSSSTEDPPYLSQLVGDALESLKKIKEQMTTEKYLKADMWCHFGRAIIRGPDEGSTFFQSCPRARKPMRLRLPLPIVTSCMHAQRYRSIDRCPSKQNFLSKQTGALCSFPVTFRGKMF